MPEIKPVSSIAEKWSRRAPSAQADYRDGVQSTTKDWAARTVAAGDAYRTGVQDAMNANRFESGVNAAGNTKWKNNTLSKGPARWVEGIQKSGDAYAKGFAPYAQVIASTTLPPRGTRGSAQNYERSRLMGEALNRERVG